LAYVAQAEGTAANVDLLAWWKAREPALPAWFKAFTIIGLIQPSSASSERGFSVFEFMFGRNELPQATEQLMETQMKAKINNK